MNPSSPDERPDARESGDSGHDADETVQKTPSTDLQPDDAGTSESGNAERGTAAEPAMKQTSKTSRETGSTR